MRDGESGVAAALRQPLRRRIIAAPPIALDTTLLLLRHRRVCDEGGAKRVATLARAGYRAASMPSDLAPFAFGLFFVAIIALVIVGIVYSVKAARKRREALDRFAAENGLRFEPGDDRSLPGTLARFATFNRGSDRRAYNTLTGNADVNGHSLAVRIGDYRYTTESGSGKDRRETTHRLSYLHARLPFAFIATLTVRRENFFDKIGGMIGFEDINFESAEFSRTFHVKSDDRKLTYDLFDPRMIEWYLPSGAPTLEIIGRDMLLTQGGTWTPEEMRTQLAWAKSFIEHWPAHVVDRLGAVSR